MSETIEETLIKHMDYIGKLTKQRDKLLAACEEADEAKNNIEKIIAYCKTDDETFSIGEDLEKLVLLKLCAATAAIAEATK